MRLGVRRPRLLVFAVATAALLSALAVPHAHADHWDGTEEHGTVEVSTNTLTIREGGSATYRFKLSHAPRDNEDGWWVRIHVGPNKEDGSVYADGDYDIDGDGQDDISWTPSVGREINQDDWTQWRDVSISALQDDDNEDQTIVFTHEVWEDDTACPIHRVGTVTVRVIDDEGTTPPPQPALSISDTTVVEGGTAEFIVTLSPASSQTVTVDHTTVMGSANPDDYSGRSDTLTFAPQATSRTVRVPTTDDNVFEGSENFTVKLSSPSGATLTDDVGIGTITDDESFPMLSIGDAEEVEEGDPASFEVTLSPASARTVTVDYRTAGGTAVEGTDYESASDTLTFDAGTTRQTIDVQTTEDSDDEPNEAFTVRLTNPNGATLADDSGSGTIRDNDEAASDLPTLSIDDASVDEGGTARFEVTLTGTSTQTVTVDYRTVGGTAVEGTDYEAADGTLMFTVGTIRQTIDVQTTEDSDDEPDEAFTVRLSSPNNATLVDDSGSGSIEDDDGGDGNNNVGRNTGGNSEHENWERRIAQANRTILPEMGRALAFNAVRCRIDQAFAGAPRGAAQPAVSPLLSIAQAAHGQGEDGTGSLTLEQVFDGSSFLLPLIEENAAAARVATWGCGDFRDLSGGGGAARWDGDAHTLQFGVDVRVAPDMLAGVAVSRSGGSFAYDGGGGSESLVGEYDLRLTGVHPYVGWSLSPDLEIWGTVGLAKGKLRVRVGTTSA